MSSKYFSLSIITAATLLSSTLQADEVNLDPIVVGADFRVEKLSKTAASVAVIGEDRLYDKSDRSFIETISSVPNVNFSAGASKPKYIQIRGIGERSQFETPINPSVGLISDGIDYSQNTLGVSLFDVKQIEVFRGSQGTTFGANALAGIVIVQSNEPTDEAGGHIEMTVGNYNAKAVGIAINAPLIENKLLSRFSLYKNTSDGYMKNVYLGREDTNNIDELNAKAQFKWFVSENHTIDLVLSHTNVNNGYDAFTLDNSRNSTSDRPGKDTLKMDALALKSTYQFGQAVHLVTAFSMSDADSLYSYDEDWSYVGAFDPALWPYSWFDSYQRHKKQQDIDVRLVSDEAGRIFNGMTDWTVGIYYKSYNDRLHRSHDKDGNVELFDSDYDADNMAFYTEFDTHISKKLLLITGIRIERWSADYQDSAGFDLNNDETMVGGKLGLNYQHNDDQLYYLTVSRGYKPGGFNATNDAGVPKTYSSEVIWNFEGGLNSKHFDGTLVSRLNFFYGKRSDQQIKLYQEQTRSFTDYLANAPKSHYYGLESQLDYYPADTLHLYASLGLLRSEIDDYYGAPLEGREPAMSPKYQYNIGLDYTFLENWVFKTNIEGKGSYYFSNTHNQKSDPYALWNASLGYSAEHWSGTFWIRNITDKDYYTRGFYFGNNPATGYADELYTQYGDPRTFGFTLSYDF
ncbi:MAG: TonB-dependent receptor [Sulfurovum sp.]|nr:TonB-dependent receptor [Sulfurovum sp.]